LYDERPTLTTDQWISVLKLSTKWFFNDLRKLAISQLSSIRMDAIDRICLAKEYRVYDWLLGAYERIVYQLVAPTYFAQTLTAEDGKKIGMEVALELSGMAILYLKSSGPLNLKAVKASILRSFSDELECVKQDELRFTTRGDRMREEAVQRATEEEKKAVQIAEENGKQPSRCAIKKLNLKKKKKPFPKDVGDNTHQVDEKQEGGEPAPEITMAPEEKRSKATELEIPEVRRGQSKPEEEEEIKSLKVDIAQKLREKKRWPSRQWRVKDDQEEDRRLTALAEKVLRGIREDPDAEKAVILNNTLDSEESRGV
jgi:hypothetical protein